MKILIIIPAYNEAENILNTIADIQNHTIDTDYLVINDCSKDDTKSVLRKAGANFVDLPVNLGIGGGVQTGYRYALDNNYDIAVQFDGDGQHMAEYLDDLLAPIKSGEADVAIGSRFIKKVGINFLSGLINLLCGVKMRDVTSGMRAVNRKMIALFAEDYPQDYPEPEAILASGLNGATIMEIPVQMREREGGVSSINPVRSVYYMIKVSLALFLSRISYGRNEA